MSDLDKYYSKFVKSVSDIGSGVLDAGSKVAKYFPGGAVIEKGTKDASKFLKDEISNKSDLRAAQTLGALSGFPIVGGFINGIQGAIQMEDLYNNTGKVPAYGGLQNLGTAGFGGALSQATRIADGRNDLYQYYAGEPDQWSINMYG